MQKQTFRDISHQIRQGLPAVLPLEMDGTVYKRQFLPPERLIILGGGHVALALYQMGRLLDFSITVVDDRPDFANYQRFPEAQVLCIDFPSAIEELRILPSDYVCVLTRGHRYDADCLRTIFRGQQPKYLGMIGSKRRVAGNKQMLLEEGVPQALLDTLHAPIGLAIGAITPQEIAVSIVAQLIQVRHAAGKESEYLAQRNTDPAVLDFLAEPEAPRAFLMVLSSASSTPVKPGSCMGTDPYGQIVGTIGGGCSESAALQQARRIIGTHQRRIITVDMTNDMAEDNGMVCGGKMTILIEDVVE